MAVKGPLLKQAAVEQTLWSKTVSAVGPPTPSVGSAADADCSARLHAAGGAFTNYWSRAEKVAKAIPPGELLPPHIIQQARHWIHHSISCPSYSFETPLGYASASAFDDLVICWQHKKIGGVQLFKVLEAVAQAKTDQSSGTREGALMHAEVGTLDAVVVISSSGKLALQDATQSIAAVDPPSQGVPMRQVRA